MLSADNTFLLKMLSLKSIFTQKVLYPSYHECKFTKIIGSLFK